jgi:hypothetical protein
MININKNKTLSDIGEFSMDRRLFLQSAVATGIAASFSSQRALAAHFSALTKISADIPAVTGLGRGIDLR